MAGARKPAKKTAKKLAKKAGQKPNNGSSPMSRTKRSYPKETFATALRVAQAIKDLNGGEPWATEDVAAALDLSKTSAKFFYVSAASRDFGLTSGSRDTAQIALTDLGRGIVYAPDPQTEQQKKLEAFLNVEVFKKVLGHYKGSDLPDMKYLGNTLEREFGLPPDTHEEFSTLFRQNCADLGIASGVPVEIATDQDGAAPAPATVVVGLPTGTDGKPRRTAFIIMPFVERSQLYPAGFFGEVLRNLLTPVGVAAGFVVSTANRQGSDLIQSTIINDLLEADLVIADLTEHNPNVLFELGVRIAEDKPVVLVKASGTGRIFDVDNLMRVYEYSANLWQSTLEKDLPAITDHIKAAWDNRMTGKTYMKVLRHQA